MTVPQGSVWQQLREHALDAVPVGSAVAFQAPTTLREWESRGTYIVDALTKKRVELITFASEFGGVLLTETEIFLDHAAEHQLTLWSQVSTKAWQSSSWQLVTIYYWAYFAALSLTRLLGRSVWHIDDAIASRLSTLAPAGSPRVGSGTFALTCEAAVGVTDRKVVLRKTSGRAHENLWRTLFAVVESAVKIAPPSSGSAEDRLYTALLRSSRILGADWPSNLRNLMNYRPGFGYGAIRHVASPAVIKRHDSPSSFDEVLTTLETSVASASPGLALERQARQAAAILGAFTFALNALARELHADVIDRAGLDRRWRDKRKNFLSRYGVISAATTWPC